MKNDAVDWPSHDLDDDGTVDRFLLLHTSRGQESGSGGPDRIWSHFTHLMDPIKVEAGVEVAHYAMATMRGGTGASGTILHEMLHQVGAIDLYPVHDPSWTGSWHGVGDWDIMASGNWNGDGVWPALPTSATMERIGLDTSQHVVLDFPVQREGTCLGPTLDLTPRHDGGKALRIDLTPEQRLFIELKGGNSYDDRLPGQGVLVTLLDEAAGDPLENEDQFIWPAMVEGHRSRRRRWFAQWARRWRRGDTFTSETGRAEVIEFIIGIEVPDPRSFNRPTEMERPCRSTPECGHGYI